MAPGSNSQSSKVCITGGEHQWEYVIGQNYQDSWVCKMGDAEDSHFVECL